MRSPFLCESSIMFKMAKMSADFLRIYRKLSTAIWYVRECGTLFDLDRANRWCNK